MQEDGKIVVLTSLGIIPTLPVNCGSAWAPVTLPVFKTGGRSNRATVCSTHTHFRHRLQGPHNISP
jgi:hypothetical protein